MQDNIIYHGVEDHYRVVVVVVLDADGIAATMPFKETAYCFYFIYLSHRSVQLIYIAKPNGK